MRENMNKYIYLFIFTHTHIPWTNEKNSNSCSIREVQKQTKNPDTVQKNPLGQFQLD